MEAAPKSEMKSFGDLTQKLTATTSVSLSNSSNTFPNGFFSSVAAHRSLRSQRWLKCVKITLLLEWSYRYRKTLVEREGAHLVYNNCVSNGNKIAKSFRCFFSWIEKNQKIRHKPSSRQRTKRTFFCYKVHPKGKSGAVHPHTTRGERAFEYTWAWAYDGSAPLSRMIQRLSDFLKFYFPSTTDHGVWCLVWLLKILAYIRVCLSCGAAAVVDS